MGFPVRFRVTTFHPRFPSLRVSRTGGGSASPLHPGGRNYTCTKFKLSKSGLPPFLALVSFPDWLFSGERVARGDRLLTIERLLRLRALLSPPNPNEHLL